jgi:hypothetical protein
MQTHDGKIAGNRQIVETYDKSHGKMPMGKKPMGRMGGGDDDSQGADGAQDMDMEEIKNLAGEHGPATKTETHHDHEAGMHRMVSHHPDGHMHHSKHGSAEEAHEAATHASGAGGDMDEHGGAHAEEEAEEEHMPGIVKQPGFMS